MNLNDLKYEILTEEHLKHDLSFKIVVVGNSGNNI